MFLEPSSEMMDLVFSKSLVDFGYCANGISSEKQEIIIKNKLNIPVIAMWPAINSELGPK